MDDLVIQGVFDFETGQMNGYDNWRRDQEERLQAMRREWGLPIGFRVRCKLYDVDREFVGQLKLVHQPTAVDRRIPLTLRIGSATMTSPEVEYCVREDGA